MGNELTKLSSDVREQVRFMKELGIEALAADLPVVDNKVEIPAGISTLRSQTVEKTAPPPEIRQRAVLERTEARKPGERLAALPSLAKRQRPQSEKNIKDEGNQILMMAASEPAKKEKEDISLIDVSPVLPESQDTMESIRAEIGACTRCPLHAQGRTQIVHTTGNFNAELMFIGEAPGADEDEQGLPFVGRAGQLLTKIIESIGLKREEVCIGNINRCRPPGNRKPEPQETASCRPFILREVAVIKPKVIVVLGATAAHNLLQIKTPISHLRGNFHDYFGVKVMPTFHPAYLLRDPHKKREVWEDMKKVRDHLNASS